MEYRCEQLAKEAVIKKSSAIKEFTLRRNEVEDLGMICGGDVTVYFRFISGGDKLVISLCERALWQFSRRRAAWLITELSDKENGEIGLFSEDFGLIGSIPAGCEELIRGQTCRFELSGAQYYAERLLTSGYVYVCGGGHVAQALVPMLASVDFRCIVLEDRPEFSDPALFPDACAVHQVPLDGIPDFADVTEDDYIVVMTRGHRFDQIVQEQALKTPAKYIGVIGSAHKKAAVLKSIMEHGFSQADIDRITTPIGLMGIHAETPAEIAISIAAQLIAFRASGEIVH